MESLSSIDHGTKYWHRGIFSLDYFRWLRRHKVCATKTPSSWRGITSSLLFEEVKICNARLHSTVIDGPRTDGCEECLRARMQNGLVAVSLELSMPASQLETPTSAPKEALLRTISKCLVNYLFGYIQT
jgi:hypothetical protein